MTKFLFISLFVLSQVSFADHGAVTKACWVNQAYHFSPYEIDCWAMHDAVQTILPTLEAKYYSVRCQDPYYGGISVAFSSLQEALTPQCQNLVDAYWQSEQITLYRDPRYCPYIADAMERLLSTLAVRNVQYYIFCNPNSTGFIQFQFEALVPASPPPEQEIPAKSP